jgi:hypothetical protein
MVPGPVLAVLLLFPITAESENARAEDEKLIKTYPVDPTVLWIKQTVCIVHSWPTRDAHDISRSETHAVQWDCASHATLWRTSCQQGRRIHALANTNVVFGPQSPLEKFIEACQGKYAPRATKLPVHVQTQKRHPRNALRCSPAHATCSLRTDVPPRARSSSRRRRSSPTSTRPPRPAGRRPSRPISTRTCTSRASCRLPPPARASSRCPRRRARARASRACASSSSTAAARARSTAARATTYSGCALRMAGARARADRGGAGRGEIRQEALHGRFGQRPVLDDRAQLCQGLAKGRKICTEYVWL